MTPLLRHEETARLRGCITGIPFLIKNRTAKKNSIAANKNINFMLHCSKLHSRLRSQKMKYRTNNEF